MERGLGAQGTSGTLAPEQGGARRKQDINEGHPSNIEAVALAIVADAPHPDGSGVGMRASGEEQQRIARAEVRGNATTCYFGELGKMDFDFGSCFRAPSTIRNCAAM